MKIFAVAVIIAIGIAFFAYKQKEAQNSQLKQLKKITDISAVINSRPIIAFSYSSKTLFVVRAKEVQKVPFIEIKNITLVTPGKISKGSNDERAVMQDYGYIILNNTDKIRFDDIPIGNEKAEKLITEETSIRVEIK